MVRKWKWYSLTVFHGDSFESRSPALSPWPEASEAAPTSQRSPARRDCRGSRVFR